MGKDDPKYHKVNVRLRAEDVAEAKRIAERDGRSWHAVLRDAVRRGLQHRPKVK